MANVEDYDDIAQQFMSVLATDESTAHATLEQVGYDLGQAITRYLSEQEAGPLPVDIQQEYEQNGVAPNTPRPSNANQRSSNANQRQSNSNQRPARSGRARNEVTPIQQRRTQEYVPSDDDDQIYVLSDDDEEIVLDVRDQTRLVEESPQLRASKQVQLRKVKSKPPFCVQFHLMKLFKQSPAQSTSKLMGTPSAKSSTLMKRPYEALEFEGEPSSKQSRMTEYLNSFQVDEHPGPSTSSARELSTDTVSRFPKDVIVMSYNIDGLDDEALDIRFSGVLAIVAKVNPDVIFFQEFVKQVEPNMREVLEKKYNIFTGYCGVPYYTVTCVIKAVKIEKSQIVDFYATQMGRNLLCVEGKWNGLNVCLINSHLESCWDQADVRKLQFEHAMAKLEEYSSQPNTLAVFGGDLNLRDNEVSNVPDGVQDAWLATGSDQALKYTWDTKLNDNKQTKKACPKPIRSLLCQGSIQDVGVHFGRSTKNQELRSLSVRPFCNRH